MSEVRVNNIVDYGGKGAPTFDNGAVISGVSSLGSQAKIGSNVTITSGGINVSGVTTAATLSGNLTGDVNSGFVTATSAVIGSGVTINAGGLNITGVVTATTFEGSGASMTGVAMTIAPLAYNPDVNAGVVDLTTGIGITFDHRILAGSGNVTLSVATNAGAAGTVVENFGVGSSVTIQGRKAIISPSSSLDSQETYHISYPSGAFTNTSGDVSYVGTAYTFGAKTAVPYFYVWGIQEDYGQLGLNNLTNYSSPVQVTGTASFVWSNWTNNGHVVTSKETGTLWSQGRNTYGQLGQNNVTLYSSPVQVPGTTWAVAATVQGATIATKTDGTLWSWGNNENGMLGQNQSTSSNKSSPVQIGSGTDWGKTLGKLGAAQKNVLAIKTDGTLWSWGDNQEEGQLGDNSRVDKSSPVQIPGTSWSRVMKGGGTGSCAAVRTDGTLWVWGLNSNGMLGQNKQGSEANARVSSPVQLPGTTWANIYFGPHTTLATKTDGTLWGMGRNQYGELAQNNTTSYSSPVQIGSDTTWSTEYNDLSNQYGIIAMKSDGTAWVWGRGSYGALGLNSLVSYSSPVQLPGGGWQGATFADNSITAIRAV